MCWCICVADRDTLNQHPLLPAHVLQLYCFCGGIDFHSQSIAHLNGVDLKLTMLSRVFLVTSSQLIQLMRLHAWVTRTQESTG